MYTMEKKNPLKPSHKIRQIFTLLIEENQNIKSRGRKMNYEHIHYEYSIRVLAIKTDNLRSMLRTYMAEENQLPQVVL